MVDVGRDNLHRIEKLADSLGRYYKSASEIGKKDDEKKFKNIKHSRKFRLIYFLVGVSLFVFLTLFLVGNDTEFFKEIIIFFILFVGGMGVGYSIKQPMVNK